MPDPPRQHQCNQRRQPGLQHTLTAALSVVATVSDLFSGQRYERVAVTPLFTLYRRSVEGRVAFIGVIYSSGGRK